MAASSEPVRDSVAGLEESESLIASGNGEEGDDDAIRELKQPATQQLGAGGVDTLSDLASPMTDQGMQNKERVAKKAEPREAGLVEKRANANERKLPKVILAPDRHPDVPRPRSKESPANKSSRPNMPFGKGQSIPSENDESNSSMLVRAQRSLDRSTLGSLNLKVVGQNAPNQFSPSKGEIGDVASGDQPTKIAKQSKIETASGGSNLDSPTTFKLQISDQAAKQMVQLLAKQADPLQQRELSFNELIRLPQSQLAAKSERGKDHDSDANLKSETDSTKFADESVADAEKPKTSGAPVQDAAVLTLASKLREHVGQRLYLYSNLPTDQAFQELDRIQSSSRSPAAGLKGMPLEAQPTPDGDSLKAKPSLGAAKPILRSRLNEFNFDYTQIIQQLKSNLEIRNKSVNPLKQ